MGVLDKARSLGIEIINSREYINLKKAEEEFHNSTEVLELIKSQKKIQNDYDNYLRHNDAQSIKKIQKKLEEINNKIEQNSIIDNLNKCQKEYDNLTKNVNNIIDYIIGRENKKGGCGGCNGCNKMD